MSKVPISIKATVLAGLAPPILQSIWLLLAPGPASTNPILLEWLVYIALIITMLFTPISKHFSIVILPSTLLLIGHITQIDLSVSTRLQYIIVPLVKLTTITSLLFVVYLLPKPNLKWWWISWPLCFLSILVMQFLNNSSTFGVVELAKAWLPKDNVSQTDSPAVTVVVIDTLRADSAVQMDSWKFLEERCATWDNALSASSWTIPSVSSLWSGVYPSEHGSIAAAENGSDILPINSEISLLPSELRDKGYSSAAFISNPLINHDLGIHHGFKEWIAVGYPLPFRLSWVGYPISNIPVQDTILTDAKIIRKRSEAWQEAQNGNGYLLWVHFFDPHLPYLHAPKVKDRSSIRSKVRFGNIRLTEEYKEKWLGLYNDEVDYTDKEFLRFLKKLDAEDYFNNHIFVFTVDHGEEFWDEGQFEHGHQHTPSVVDIPIAYCSPSTVPSRRTDLASIIDISSTIRAELNIPTDGYDLRQPIPEDRVAFAMTNKYDLPQITVRQGDTRIVRTFASYEYTKFTDKVYSGKPSDYLNGLLSEATEYQPRAEGKKGVDQNEAQLRALGYIE